MASKMIIILLMLIILYCLGSSFFFLLRDNCNNKRTLSRLMWRVGISILAFAFIILAYFMGWIHPSEIGLRLLAS